MSGLDILNANKAAASARAYAQDLDKQISAAEVELASLEEDSPIFGIVADSLVELLSLRRTVYQPRSVAPPTLSAKTDLSGKALGKAESSPDASLGANGNIQISSGFCQKFKGHKTKSRKGKPKGEKARPHVPKTENKPKATPQGKSDVLILPSVLPCFVC